MFKKTLISVALATIYVSANADGYSNSHWLNTIGVSKTIQSQSLGGSGLTLGIIDTGIVSNNAQVTGRVSTLSSCTNVSKGCGTTGIVDDTGHGTAVSSVAAGGVITSNNSMVGVAPKVNMLMERGFIKGVASPTDYQNSIKKAVDAGADVINISGGFSASPVVIDAINYAASKGVYVVFAAGNTSSVFNNGTSISGLTLQGVKHLVLVGSTNADGKTKASFSNIPNYGAMVDTNGVKTTFSANWLMAPGEAIMAPYASPSNLIVGGNPYAYWSGTSFSAPQVSGALILLESTWKILKTNSTAAELLFKTATSLGSTSTYGNGLLNVTKAFAPYGDLKITKADGSTISTSSLTTAMVSSGALGNLATLSNRLSNYNAFDGYTRNYAVNLSNMIVTSNNTKPVATITTMNPTPIVSRFNGFSLSLTKAATQTDDLQSVARKELYAYQLATEGGIVLGIGNGFSFSNTFSNALYNSPLAYASENLGISNSLTSIASGGIYSSYGIPITNDTRFSFSQTNSNSNNWYDVSAKGSMMGISTKLSPQITLAITTGQLQEDHGVLGSTYNKDSILSFGGATSSNSNSISIGYSFSKDSTFLIEYLRSNTSVTPSSNGLISNTSQVTATAWGIAYNHTNLYSMNDTLSISAKSPLRVTSGTTKLFYQDVDTYTGCPISKNESVSLVPEGYEVQYALGYVFNTSKTSKVSTLFTYAKDAGNVKGEDATVLTIKFSKEF